MTAQATRVTGPPSGFAPDTQALLTMRRVMSMVLAMFGALSSCAVAAIHGSDLNTVDGLLASLALVLLITGLVGARNPRMLWFLVAALACMPLAALLAPQNSAPWVVMPNAAANTSYLLILLVPRWPGLLVPPAAAGLILTVQHEDSSNVFSTSAGLLGGWFPALQILAAGLLLWWAWWTLVQESSRVDTAALAEEVLADRAIAAHQRAQVWRRGATRLHESALNVIAHVLTATSIDRVSLAQQLARYFTWRADDQTEDEDAPDESSGSIGTLGQALRTAVTQYPRRAEVIIEEPIANVDLPADTREVLIAAVNELLINAERHGDARVVRIAADADDEHLLVTVTDDGTGLPSTSEPGIGLGTVLSDRVFAAGGAFSLDSTSAPGVRASLRLPIGPGLAQIPEGTGNTNPFDKGRLLVSAPLAGLTLVGMTSFMLLPQRQTLPSQLAWTICGLGVALALVCVITVVRRLRIGLAETLALAPAPIAIAGLLLAMPATCTDAALIGMVLNITGLCTVLIAMWGNPVAGAITLATWAVAALSVVRIYPLPCTIVVGQALNNSLIVVPVLIIVAYLGGRAFLKAQRRRMTDRAEHVATLARVSASRDLDASVSGLIRQARGLLDAIAHGHAIDSQTRHRLEVVDGRLRAAIQVDPLSSGGMSLAAHRIVEVAAQRDDAILVRSISSSLDPRPVPPPVIELLADLIPEGEGTGVLRAMGDGEEDHLALTTTRARLDACGLAPGQHLILEGVSIEVEHDDDARGVGVTSDLESTLTVLVSRPVLEQAASTGDESTTPQSGTRDSD